MKRRISMLSTLALGGVMVLNNAVDVNAAPALNPYNGVEAEVNFGQKGIEIVEDNGGKVASSIEAGDYFIVKDVNFAKGVSQFKVKAKADKASWVEIREGGVDGDVIAQLRIGSTDGEYKEIVTASTKNLDGKTNIAFVGKVGSCSIDKWSVTEASDKADDKKDDSKKEDNNASNTGSSSKTTTGVTDDRASEKTGPGPWVNPYEDVLVGRSFSNFKGIEIKEIDGTNVITSLEENDSFVVNNIDLKEGIAALNVSIKADKDSTLEIRDGSVDGKVLGMIKVKPTNGEYKSFITKMENIEGVHAFVFVGKGGDISINKWNAMSAPKKKTEDAPSTGSSTEQPGNNQGTPADNTGKEDNKGSNTVVNPYQDVYAGATLAKKSGVDVADVNGNKVITGLETGDYFTVENVDFQKGVATFFASVESDGIGSVEVRDGSPDGALIGSFKINNTNGEYKSFFINPSKLEGKHTIVFVGKMGNVSIEKWHAMSAPDKKNPEQTNPGGNTNPGGQTTPGGNTNPGGQETTPTPQPQNPSSGDLSDGDKDQGKTGRGPMVNPYSAVSTGVSFGDSKGTETTDYNGSKVVSSLEQGDYFIVNNVNFKNGVSKIYAKVKADKTSAIEIREGGVNGKVLGLLKVNGSNGNEYKEIYVPIKDNLEGVHALAFVGKMGDASIADWHAEAAQADNAGEAGTDNKGTDNRKEAVVNPYDGVYAGTNLGKTSGVEIVDHNGNKIVSDLGEGDYFVVKDVNLDKGLITLNSSIKSDNPAVVEVRDGLDGELLGTIRVTATNGEYKAFVTQMKNVEGKHDLAFIGKKGTVSIDSWKALSAPSKNPGNGQGTENTNPTPQPGSGQGTENTNPTPQPGSGQGTENTTPTPQPGNGQETQNPTKNTGLKLSHAVNDWGCGHLIDFRITNQSGKTTDGWKLKIKKDNINIAQSWCVDIKEEGDYYVITPLFWNSQINDGNFVQFGIIGVGRGPQSISYMFE